MAAHNIRRLVEVFRFTIGTLRSDGDSNGNKTSKKGNGKISKTTMHVLHVFLYISMLSLHDHDLKMPNFTFIEDVIKPRQNFLSFSELGYGSS